MFLKNFRIFEIFDIFRFLKISDFLNFWKNWYFSDFWEFLRFLIFWEFWDFSDFWKFWDFSDFWKFEIFQIFENVEIFDFWKCWDLFFFSTNFFFFFDQLFFSNNFFFCRPTFFFFFRDEFMLHIFVTHNDTQRTTTHNDAHPVFSIYNCKIYIYPHNAKISNQVTISQPCITSTLHVTSLGKKNIGSQPQDYILFLTFYNEYYFKYLKFINKCHT